MTPKQHIFIRIWAVSLAAIVLSIALSTVTYEHTDKSMSGIHDEAIAYAFLNTDTQTPHGHVTLDNGTYKIQITPPLTTRIQLSIATIFLPSTLPNSHTTISHGKLVLTGHLPSYASQISTLIASTRSQVAKTTNGQVSTYQMLISGTLPSWMTGDNTNRPTLHDPITGQEIPFTIDAKNIDHHMFYEIRTSEPACTKLQKDHPDNTIVSPPDNGVCTIIPISI